jgi:hypothetical protein
MSTSVAVQMVLITQAIPLGRKYDEYNLSMPQEYN